LELLSKISQIRKVKFELKIFLKSHNAKIR
jgi:hypothetical protein